MLEAFSVPALLVAVATQDERRLRMKVEAAAPSGMDLLREALKLHRRGDLEGLC